MTCFTSAAAVVTVPECLPVGDQARDVKWEI